MFSILRLPLVSALALLFTTGMPWPGYSAAPAGFVETELNDSALGNATGMAWAPDGSGRLFVIKKGGEIRVVQNGAVLPALWATISPVYTNSECGLIGMCFDPDFVTNRYVYFFVTVSATEQRIIRYRDQGGIGVEKTALVAGLPTAGENHDGGAIAIGADGYLYWGIGDLGNGTGVDGDLTSLAAKIGRADRFTGQPAPDNPFADGPGPNNEYIWARGYRNPFTMTMHPITGALWINVVGTNYEQIFVPPAGSHAGYNDYENNQPNDFLQPALVYRTNGTDSPSIPASGVVRVSGITTVTIATDRKFRAGERVTISGVGDTSFNGSFYVREGLTARTFTISQPGQNNATSGGGTVASANLGGCITGGSFYDSTLFPAEYHGNFFFGDFNSGEMTRVRLDSSGNVTNVDEFLTGATQNTDVTVGPDGALYYIGVSTNRLKRLVPQTVAPTLVVQPTAIRVQPGGSSVFTVQLSEPPTGTVTVNLSKIDGGDEDLTLGASTLQFTAANWNQSQTVTINGAVNSAAVRGSATFRVAADGGFGTYDVLATELSTGGAAAAPVATLLYKKGDAVPGEPSGSTFESFGLPSLDGDRVGFDAIMNVDRKRVTVIVGGDPTRVLWRVGETAPGVDTAFTKISDPVFNGGHLAFLGTVANGTGVTAANNAGLWSDARGTLTLVARKGDVAPGTEGAKFASFTALNLPEVGGVVYLAKLAIGSGTAAPKVNVNTDLGLWREGLLESQLLIREGGGIEVASGDTRKVRSFQVLPNVVGSPDQRRAVRADGTVAVYVTFTDQSQALVEFPPIGAPELLVLTPNTPAAPVLKSLGLPAQHSDAQVFRGTLNAVTPVTKNSDTGIFSVEGGGGVEAVVQEGTPLASPAQAQFSLLETPAFAGGELLFLGTLGANLGDATTKNDRGLWLTNNGPLGPLAREGQMVNGRVLSAFTQYAGSPESSAPAVVGFTAKLRRINGVNATNDLALLTRTAEGSLHLVQRKGDPVQLEANGAMAKVSAINAFQATPRTYGQGRSVSRTGKLIYRATLSKAGQAIFVVEPPVVAER